MYFLIVLCYVILDVLESLIIVCPGIAGTCDGVIILVVLESNVISIYLLISPFIIPMLIEHNLKWFQLLLARGEATIHSMANIRDTQGMSDERKKSQGLEMKQTGIMSA